MSGLDALLQRPRPSIWQQIVREPCIFIATELYSWRRVSIPAPSSRPIAVVCISDTHNRQPQDTPEGDLLIHAGDLTQSGTLKELQTSLDWLKTLPHQYKIVIAGNHDILLDSAGVVANASARASIDWGEMIYLNSSSKVLCINGRHINIYGSPLTPRHGNWAFQYPRNEDVWKDTIPRDTDILITHGPPKGHLDAGRLGCESLLNEVGRVKPKLHVFGHIHAGYGMERVQYDGLQSAYERTVVRGGGLWNLGRVLIELVKTYLFPGTIGSSRGVFVNAAIVGGLRDEQMRRPITVYI